MEKMIHLFEEVLEKNELIDAVWSNPRNKDAAYQKITCKPILLKDVLHFQCVKMQGQKALHTNVLPEELVSFIKNNCTSFKQVQMYTASKDYSLLINKKGECHIKAKMPTKKCAENLMHNRQKHYLLDAATSKGFLTQLGLMSIEGTIKPSKYDKYKQINKYLEFVESVIDYLPEGVVRIVDFGCGKSYLTFAMYHYFHEMLHKEVEIVGLDLKEDVIAFCNNLAKTLNYPNLFFQVGDIGNYTTDKPVDIVVSLHACNTATDAALMKAVGWQAKVILAVPCCHHECYTQLQNHTLAPLLKHGILKERMAALITDGMRAQMLEAKGYKVNVMEFIDMAHTPKNILIRAIKTQSNWDEKAYTAYETLSKALNLDLTIGNLANNSKEV